MVVLQFPLFFPPTLPPRMSRLFGVPEPLFCDFSPCFRPVKASYRFSLIKISCVTRNHLEDLPMFVPAVLSLITFPLPVFYQAIAYPWFRPVADIRGKFSSTQQTEVDSSLSSPPYCFCNKNLPRFVFSVHLIRHEYLPPLFPRGIFRSPNSTVFNDPD